MNREIKFRAYFDQYNRMIENIGFVNSKMILVDFSGYGNIENLFLTDEIHIMQFTGLKNKNQKMIYEGDIVKCKNHTVIVFFADGAFKVKYRKTANSTCTMNLAHFLEQYNCEVIGNIYENSELLEGRNEIKSI